MDVKLGSRKCLERAGAGTLSVASFNVKNLSVRQAPERFLALGRIIAQNLAAPDLVAVQREIQDDNGTGDDGSRSVSARLTLDTLVGAIEEEGGPTYRWVQIDPKYGNDGGAILSNIRTAFLVRGDGPLRFVSRPGGDAETAVRVVTPEPGEGEGPRLSHSPGRIAPDHAAFRTSRKPLVAELRWGETTIFAINVHYNARLADDPLMCCRQPPEHPSSVRRMEQARIVHGFVRELLAVDPGARVIVLGDFNTFEFEPGVRETAGDDLTVLTDRLPSTERYSYVYQGNAQMLDHVLVSPTLEREFTTVEVVHVNAEQPAVVQASDHDPVLARFAIAAGPLPPAPTPTARPTPPRITVRDMLFLPYGAAAHDLGRVAPEPTPRPTLRPTETPRATPIARIQGPYLAYLGCAGRDELALLRHGGREAVDVTGWTLVSVVGNQRLGLQGILVAGDEVEIHSGPDAPPDGPGVIRWRRSYVWTDDDEAELYDARGALVNRLACGENVEEPLGVSGSQLRSSERAGVRGEKTEFPLIGVFPASLPVNPP